MLLCGSDLLETLWQPGIWKPEDVKSLVEVHGIVCLLRGDEKKSFVSKHNLSQYMERDIFLIEEPLDGNISSSEVRQKVAEGGSIEHLVPHSVLEYITHHGLYQRQSYLHCL